MYSYPFLCVWQSCQIYIHPSHKTTSFSVKNSSKCITSVSTSPLPPHLNLILLKHWDRNNRLSFSILLKSQPVFLSIWRATYLNLFLIQEICFLFLDYKKLWQNVARDTIPTEIASAFDILVSAVSKLNSMFCIALYAGFIFIKQSRSPPRFSSCTLYLPN